MAHLSHMQRIKASFQVRGTYSRSGGRGYIDRFPLVLSDVISRVVLPVETTLGGYVRHVMSLLGTTTYEKARKKLEDVPQCSLVYLSVSYVLLLVNWHIP